MVLLFVLLRAQAHCEIIQISLYKNITKPSKIENNKITQTSKSVIQFTVYVE